jgi:hypothetical protein
MTTGGGSGDTTATVGIWVGVGGFGGLVGVGCCFRTGGGEGFDTGLAFGTGFGPVFLVGEVCEGRFGGGAIFFEVGIDGFLVGAAFWELGGELFCALRKAFFFAASESAALTESRERVTLPSARSGRIDTKNRGSTRQSPAGRVPSDELGFLWGWRSGTRAAWGAR